MAAGENPYRAPEYADCVEETNALTGGDTRGVAFISAHPRALWTILLLAALSIFNCLTIASRWMQIWAVAEVNSVASEIALAIDFFGAAVRACQISVLVGLSVVFLSWVHGTYRNLPALGGGHVCGPPAWPVVCLCIPVVNLFSSYRVLNAIWRGSDPGGMPNRRGDCLIILWWIACLIGCAAAPAALPWDASQVITAIAVLQTSHRSIAVNVSSLPAILLTMAVVWKIDSGQERRFGLLHPEYWKF